MIDIGRQERLQIVKFVDHGAYLDGFDWGEILLPKQYIPTDFEVGDWIEVFIYFDSEDRPVATTETPFTMVGEFAYLECVATTQIGAFLNWGLSKDLFVPFREQKRKMFEGKSYIVHTYFDESSERIVASAKIDKFLRDKRLYAQEGDQVDIIIGDSTDLGYKAIINHSAWGILYKNEVFEKISYGDYKTAYIKKIRPDGKIDLSLHKSSMDQRDDAMVRILELLEQNDGFLSVSDKTDPERIKELFGISKKLYKKTVGNLYKERTIAIENDGIRLIKK